MYILNTINILGSDSTCFAGTAAYDKLKSLLTAKLLLGDIKKLSSDAQTSCLEGFHATLNHWQQKILMAGYFLQVGIIISQICIVI